MASELSDSRQVLDSQQILNVPPHLRIEGLAKAFGERGVLRGVNLEVMRGEFVVIIGKSGCGKSTLLRLLAGLETPNTGEITIGSTPLNGLNTAARVMFQDARLLPWERVLENVGLGVDQGEWRAPAEAALRDVGLLDRAKDFPGVLSGGQRQRVALARALACQPEILLLDEPLGALDALTRLEMQKLIARLWEQHGWTVFLVTHDVEEAILLADRVILLEEGQIVLNLPVTLPRPRHRTSPAYVDLTEELLNRLQGGAWGDSNFGSEEPKIQEAKIREKVNTK